VIEEVLDYASSGTLDSSPLPAPRGAADRPLRACTVKLQAAIASSFIGETMHGNRSLRPAGEPGNAREISVPKRRSQAPVRQSRPMLGAARRSGRFVIPSCWSQRTYMPVLRLRPTSHFCKVAIFLVAEPVPTSTYGVGQVCKVCKLAWFKKVRFWVTKAPPTSASWRWRRFLAANVANIMTCGPPSPPPIGGGLGGRHPMEGGFCNLRLNHGRKGHCRKGLGRFPSLQTTCLFCKLAFFANCGHGRRLNPPWPAQTSLL